MLRDNLEPSAFGVLNHCGLSQIIGLWQDHQTLACHQNLKSYIIYVHLIVETSHVIVFLWLLPFRPNFWRFLSVFRKNESKKKEIVCKLIYSPKINLKLLTFNENVFPVDVSCFMVSTKIEKTQYMARIY